MDWTKASDKQLWTIAKYDPYCPPSLLRGVVIEMLNRGLWDRIINSCIHKQLKDVTQISQVFKLDAEDFYQIGRLAVYQSLDVFDPSRGKPFHQFVYLKVKNKIWTFFEWAQSQKRDARKVVSYHAKAKEDEFETFLPDKVNVERYVINKVTLEQLMKRISPHQKNVLNLRLKGFTFAEIAEILGRGTTSTMSQAYNLAIKKMRKGA